MYGKIRGILTDYYFNTLTGSAKRLADRVFSRMDEYYSSNPEESSYKMKAKLYETIVDGLEPTVFDDIPFYFETGGLVAFSDGKFNRGGINHANGWLYLRREHLFRDVDPHAYDVYRINRASALLGQTGSFVDMMHIGLPMKKIFKIGLKGIYEECESALSRCSSDEERDFVSCSMTGILSLKKIADKFSLIAQKQGAGQIADMAHRIPWNPPKTFHEGLATLAFIRKALGVLEGVGFNSFGRVDLLLEPLYESDVERGVSEEEMLDLVIKFLLIWDCTLDRSTPMTGRYEYELENTLTLGGIDINNRQVYNGVTRLFLTARNKENILYPKMMLRYSENSSEEYLKAITAPLLEGKSFSIYANDGVIIPALLKSGVEYDDAVDYIISGCWDALTPDVANRFSGEYVNILSALAWPLHGKRELMDKNELDFVFPETAESFEELYSTYLDSVKTLIMKKAEPMSVASLEWHKVNPLPTLSALMEPCIPALTDITAGGGKYNRETMYFSGFAEVVDSLLAIKSLCFDKKECTLSELFLQCREDFSDEILRQKALRAPKYGDGTEESSLFAARFHDDLYRLSRDLPTAYGGQFRIGYNQYTEIIWWGKETGATPNGRKKGDYLSQGLTPSRLVNGATAAGILGSMRYIDMEKCAANASVSLTLPLGGLDPDRAVAVFRAACRIGIPSLQPNAVSREALLAAQKEPEKYGHIIVRVCGFSAPFVLLSEEYQNEFLSRLSSEF